MDYQWQTDRSKRAGVSSLLFAVNIVFQKVDDDDDDDDDDGVVMMMQTHLREEQEALLVNSVLKAKATTGLQVERSADWSVKTSLWSRPSQRCNRSLYVFFFSSSSFVALCMFVYSCVTAQEHETWSLHLQSLWCMKSSLVLFSFRETKPVLFFTLSLSQRTPEEDKVSSKSTDSSLS